MSTLFESFKTRAEAVSAEVHRVATRRAPSNSSLASCAANRAAPYGWRARSSTASTVTDSLPAFPA